MCIAATKVRPAKREKQMSSATLLGAAAEAIQSHYDVGNDFYGLWLDPTLCYSCAIWEDESDAELETAQRRKLAYHIQQSQARNANRVLDIGCGWGAMLRQLVQTEGVRNAVGLTLSRKQAAWIAQSPDPRIEVRLETWADHIPVAPYDAMISVGAFEHFARPENSNAEKVSSYREFFSRCYNWLRPGGRLSLQTIAYGNEKADLVKGIPEHRFLAEEIFPESELPSLGNIIQASDGLFEILAVRNDREDYSRTCRVWFERLSAQKAAVKAVTSEAVFKRFARYLKLMAALFHYGHLCLLRLVLRRVETPH